MIEGGGEGRGKGRATFFFVMITVLDGHLKKIKTLTGVFFFPNFFLLLLLLLLLLRPAF